MKFNSNNDLIPGNFFSKTKEKELENKIEALTQLVTFLSDKITQLESAIVTGTATNLWKLKEADENYIEPKNEKKLAGDVVNVEYENEVNTLQNIIPKLGKTKTVNNFAPDNSGNILVSWCGTKNEYEEIKDTIPDGVIVHVIGE